MATCADARQMNCKLSQIIFHLQVPLRLQLIWHKKLEAHKRSQTKVALRTRYRPSFRTRIGSGAFKIGNGNGMVIGPKCMSSLAKCLCGAYI